MSGSADCLAVIPARGGSKRIVGKNVRRLLGKPLLAYTVDAALQSGIFGRVVVTTDSPEIAEVARRSGAEVPFLREERLADDFVPVSVATIDVLERLDPSAGDYDTVCQLMPNCPLRTAGDICQSYAQFRQVGAESQLSVVRYGWQNPWWAMRRGEGMRLTPLFEEAMTRRSQDLDELFCPTGAVWWAVGAALRREGSYHMPGKTGWEIPWQRGLDIDTEDDWALAEALLRMPGAPTG